MSRHLKTLSYADQRELIASLKLAEIALTNAHIAAREAAVVTMSPFSEGAYDTALAVRLHNRLSDVHAIRTDIEAGNYTKGRRSPTQRVNAET